MSPTRKKTTFESPFVVTLDSALFDLSKDNFWPFESLLSTRVDEIVLKMNILIVISKGRLCRCIRAFGYVSPIHLHM
jgi:hypothetical protein